MRMHPHSYPCFQMRSDARALAATFRRIFLPSTFYQLPTSDCRLPTADCRLPTADCLLPTAYCLLHPSYPLWPVLRTGLVGRWRWGTGRRALSLAYSSECFRPQATSPALRDQESTWNQRGCSKKFWQLCQVLRPPKRFAWPCCYATRPRRWKP